MISQSIFKMSVDLKKQDARLYWDNLVSNDGLNSGTGLPDFVLLLSNTKL